MATVKIHSGLFRHTLKFENPVKQQDIAGGNQVIQYEDLVITKGYFRERDGFRQIEEGYDQLVWEYECYTWWRNELEANVTKDTRIIYENRIYKLVSKKRLEEDRMFMRFLLITEE